MGKTHGTGCGSGTGKGNHGTGCRVGFDLGGTKMVARIFSESYEPIARAKTRVRAHLGSEQLIDDIVQTVHKALKKANLGLDEVIGLGIGVPGPVDSDGSIVFAPNLSIEDFPMQRRLEKALDIPIAIDNDVNLGLFGEIHFGAARGARDVLGVFPGTGIGGALVIGGILHRGASGAAGEIGHTIVLPDGPRCGCGKRGCLEALYSRSAISAHAAVLSMRGAAPYLAEHVGTDPREIRSGALARAIEHGDLAVQDLVEHAARGIGRGISGILNAVSPEMVLLGGGLVEALPGLFVEQVSRGISETTVTCIAEKIEVVCASLGDDAVVMGAAKLLDH